MEGGRGNVCLCGGRHLREGRRYQPACDLCGQGRDGQGPDVETVRRLSTGTKIEIIASGGIRDLDDLLSLERVEANAAIIGRALYEGGVKLGEFEEERILMALAKRIVPCLDVKDGSVVKGVKFEGLRDAGDPVELAEKYRDEGADEIVFLDITASLEKRATLRALVRRVAANLDIPFTVGGGIRTMSDARLALCSGADKVAVNTAAIQRPGLITKLAGVFGSQCVVVAIDARRMEGGMRSPVIQQPGEPDWTPWSGRGGGEKGGWRAAGDIDRQGRDEEGLRSRTAQARSRRA